MSTSMLNAISCEIKNNFFVYLSEKVGVEHSELCSFWDQYFSTPSSPITSVLSTTTKTSKPILKTKKAPLKDKKDRVDCLSRSDQTSINFGDIDKMKVAELKKYNKERGLPISGTKADLIGHLKRYEQNDTVNSDDELEEDQEQQEQPRSTKKPKKPITVLNPKKKSNKKNEVVQEKVEAVISVIDGKDVPIVDGNLVCEEENDELIVVGCLDETGCIVKLSQENIERCKELKIKFNSDEVDVL